MTPAQFDRMRIQRADREDRQGKIPASSAAGTGERSGYADRADVPADAGSSTSFSQKPRCGLLCRIATGTAQLGTERAAVAHQQRRRSVSAHVAGAGCAPHSRSVWSGQRSATLGSETGRARREERKETSGDCDSAKVSSFVASVVGQRRSLRTVALQPPGSDAGSRISQKHPRKEKQKPKRRVPVTALIAWPNFHSQNEWEVDNQVAAPAETRTPNLHRARIAHQECGWKGSDSGPLGRRTNLVLREKRKNPLDSDRPSHGRRLHALTAGH
jgi:hypothetical protein